MRIFTFAVISLILPLLVSCSSDPKMGALREGVDLMETIITSKTLYDAVSAADPQMKPSTAVYAAFRGGVTSNFPLPPDDIAMVEGGRPTQPWCVVLVGDDEKKVVRIEGYGNDLTKPLIIKTVRFPQ